MIILNNIVETPMERQIRLYTIKSPVERAYIEQQFSMLPQINDPSVKLMFDRCMALYNSYNDQNLIQYTLNTMGDAAARNAGVAVYFTDNLSVMRAMQNTMQRYMMANPVVRNLYHKQRCDGYSGSYVDNDYGVSGENHDEYRAINNGIVKETEDGWQYVNYMDVYDENGNEKLSASDKFKILSVWDVANAFINAGEDPTDKYCGKL